MKYKWFKDCQTAEAGKELYRQLCKKFHPDNTPDGAAIMAEINDEFREWWKAFKNIHETAEGQRYTKETTETADEFIDILEKLSHLPGLTIDLCGSWLWISGNTFPVRDKLASAGCHWSKGHKKWFWAADIEKKSGKGHASEKQITEKYGRQRVNVTYKPVYNIE